MKKWIFDGFVDEYEQLQFVTTCHPSEKLNRLRGAIIISGNYF